MKNKHIVQVSFFFLITTFVYGQNEPFSQFYNSRLAVNPALTGHIINDWRLQDVFSYREYLHGKYYNANNLALELKFPIAKRSFFYGVVEEDYTNLVIGVGLTDDRHSMGYDTARYSSDYLTLAVHKKIFKDAQVSVGAQAGMISYLSKNSFDANVGLLLASKRIDCEYGHQIFKYELGVSYFHTSKKFHSSKDTLLNPSAEIQAHGGMFVKLARKINFEGLAHYEYNSSNYYHVGGFLISRSKHPTYDGLRFGMFYRNTDHLVFAGGVRIFGNTDQTLAADVTLSYDLNLNGFYKNGVELSVAVYPLRKCWKIQTCIPNK